MVDYKPYLQRFLLDQALLKQKLHKGPICTRVLRMSPTLFTNSWNGHGWMEGLKPSHQRGARLLPLKGLKTGGITALIIFG